METLSLKHLNVGIFKGNEREFIYKNEDSQWSGLFISLIKDKYNNFSNIKDQIIDFLETKNLSFEHNNSNFFIYMDDINKINTLNSEILKITDSHFFFACQNGFETNSKLSILRKNSITYFDGNFSEERFLFNFENHNHRAKVIRNKKDDIITVINSNIKDLKTSYYNFIKEIIVLDNEETFFIHDTFTFKCSSTNDETNIVLPKGTYFVHEIFSNENKLIGFSISNTKK